MLACAAAGALAASVQRLVLARLAAVGALGGWAALGFDHGEGHVGVIAARDAVAADASLGAELEGSGRGIGLLLTSQAYLTPSM